MHVVIARDPRLSSKKGEYGHVFIDGQRFCATCEQRWNDNRRASSCRPAGAYELRPFDSPAHGPTVVFHNPALNVYATPSLVPRGVVGRSLCEILNANWPFQLKVCVAVGADLADIASNGLGVASSVVTFHAFTSRLSSIAGLTASIINSDGLA